MTDADLIRWLVRVRHGAEFRGADGGKTIPFVHWCRWMGLARKHLYDVMDGREKLGDYASVRLEAGIRAIEQGLRWRRNGQHWEIVGKGFVPPPKLPYHGDHAE